MFNKFFRKRKERKKQAIINLFDTTLMSYQIDVDLRLSEFRLCDNGLNEEQMELVNHELQHWGNIYTREFNDKLNEII